MSTYHDFPDEKVHEWIQRLADLAAHGNTEATQPRTISERDEAAYALHIVKDMISEGRTAEIREWAWMDSLNDEERREYSDTVAREAAAYGRAR